MAHAKNNLVIFFTTRCSMASGAALNARRLAASFRDQGINAECWALYCTDPAVPPGINKCFLPAPPAGLGDWARMMRSAITALWQANPRAIYGFNPLANVLGCTLALMRGCKARIGTQRNPTQSQTPLLKWLDLLCGSVGIYTDNICVSPDVARTYGGYPAAYRKLIKVIWNGVPVRLSSKTKSEARGAFNLPAGAPLIGSVGRLAKQKNQRFLLDVLPLLPHVHLAIAGNGELEAELKAAAAARGLHSRVHFLGSIAGDDVPDFLRALDIFVFPSAYEGFGLALIEAMQHGLPCTTSDIGTFRDILRNDKGENAGLPLPFDAARWAAELQRLFDDAQHTAHISRLAVARAADFSFEAMRDRYKDVFLQRAA